MAQAIGHCVEIAAIIALVHGVGIIAIGHRVGDITTGTVHGDDTAEGIIGVGNATAYGCGPIETGFRSICNVAVGVIGV